MFNAEKAAQMCVEWIRNFFLENGKDCNAIVGISGGKDSSVTAALLVKALGKERVIGVLMPNEVQKDIDCARQLVDFLGIKNIEVNIADAVNGILNGIKNGKCDGKNAGEFNLLEVSEQTKTNIPPRIRMTTLYAVGQSLNGRVVNTCNMSEDWVGYSTRYGDAAGDFSPLANFTVTEVKAIGEYLNLPSNLINKVPMDGLCGKTDEENLGFTYEMLDKYIRHGIEPPKDIKDSIDEKHKNNLFKLMLMPAFEVDADELYS